MSALRVTASALLLASASCTLLTDTSGYSGAGDDAGAAADGGADVVLDVAGEADTGSSVACPTGATLCLDFDTDPFDKGTFQIENKPSSVVEASPLHFVSAPRGMHVGVVDPGGLARLEAPIPATAKHTRLSFSIWIDPPPLSGTQRISIGELLCQRTSDASTTYLGAFLFLEPSRLAVRGSTDLALIDLPRRRFARVVLDAVWRAADGDVEVMVDGTSLGKGTLRDSCIGEQNWKVVMGISTGGVSAPIDAYYDDVVFQAE